MSFGCNVPHGDSPIARRGECTNPRFSPLQRSEFTRSQRSRPQVVYLKASSRGTELPTAGPQRIGSRTLPSCVPCRGMVRRCPRQDTCAPTPDLVISRRSSLGSMTTPAQPSVYGNLQVLDRTQQAFDRTRKACEARGAHARRARRGRTPAGAMVVIAVALAADLLVLPRYRSVSGRSVPCPLAPLLDFRNFRLWALQRPGQRGTQPWSDRITSVVA